MVSLGERRWKRSIGVFPESEEMSKEDQDRFDRARMAMKKGMARHVFRPKPWMVRPNSRLRVITVRAALLAGVFSP